MSSARDIIQEALEALNVYNPGEQTFDADVARCFFLLNDLLDAWANEYLYFYYLGSQSFPLVQGQGSYTIGNAGAGANIVAPRPTRIAYGPGAASVVSAGVQTAINVVSAVEWTAIESMATTSEVPDTLFYDPAYPVGVLNIAPSPTAAGGVVTFSPWLPLTAFPNLNNEYNLTFGEQEAIKFNLALKAHPYFLDGPPNPIVALNALKTKTFLKDSNIASRGMLGRGMQMGQSRGGQGANG